MKAIWALGVGAGGSGYPNGPGTIALLAKHPCWSVIDRVRWLPADVQLWRLAKGGVLERARILWCLGIRSIFLPIDLLRARLAGAAVFAPYPALFFLAAARCMPRRFRPRIIADSFISVWDSGFSDRKFTRANGRVSRAVNWFESWCLCAADAVIVDTFENGAFFEQHLSVPSGKIHVLPLAVETRQLISLGPPLPTESRPLRVLYVGTFVPLHGFSVIVDALHQLSSADNVEFRIVGDGQDSQRFEDAMQKGFSCRVTWIREWQSLDELANHYAWADVCLGVFGSEGKASRVMPFKVYAAFAACRAVVTQDDMGSPVLERAPVITSPSDGTSLAERLRSLASEPEMVSAFALAGRDFFQRNLSSVAVSNAWSDLWVKVEAVERVSRSP
ncbi:glycosyltransferase [Silanimonas sp.]|jgi:glycosyltransferase involved in cell wall biosynthesis|uniref:glycosyltransferase n=1 Tax=Silanimonas sp. TaxID=1929290 RepID=UPI0022C1A469|nr:glycosyltransferase [Silanimonas sp.]MCZ8062370.1 glycosyltransferase [Silanimonas sp.]